MVHFHKIRRANDRLKSLEISIEASVIKLETLLLKKKKYVLTKIKRNQVKKEIDSAKTKLANELIATIVRKRVITWKRDFLNQLRLL